MEKTFASKFGAGLTILTLAGFTKSSRPKHLFGLMNVDTQHSLLRIPLTLALLHAASQQVPLRGTRAILSFIGGFYIAIGFVGMADKSAGGMLPSRLTNFDLVYHFGVGALALWLGGRSGRMMKP